MYVFKKYLCNLWLCWVFLPARILSLVLASRATLAVVLQLLIAVAFVLLWPMGSVVLWHVESSGPGIKPVSSALQGRFLTTDHQRNPHIDIVIKIKNIKILLVMRALRISYFNKLSIYYTAVVTKVFTVYSTLCP